MASRFQSIYPKSEIFTIVNVLVLQGGPLMVLMIIFLSEFFPLFLFLTQMTGKSYLELLLWISPLWWPLSTTCDLAIWFLALWEMEWSQKFCDILCIWPTLVLLTIATEQLASSLFRNLLEKHHKSYSLGSSTSPNSPCDICQKDFFNLFSESKIYWDIDSFLDLTFRDQTWNWKTVWNNILWIDSKGQNSRVFSTKLTNSWVWKNFFASPSTALSWVVLLVWIVSTAFDTEV